MILHVICMEMMREGISIDGWGDIAIVSGVLSIISIFDAEGYSPTTEGHRYLPVGPSYFGAFLVGLPPQRPEQHPLAPQTHQHGIHITTNTSASLTASSFRPGSFRLESLPKQSSARVAGGVTQWRCVVIGRGGSVFGE